MPSQPITFIKGDKSSSETDFRDLLPQNMSGVIRQVFSSQGYMNETPGLLAFGTAFGVDRGGLWNEQLGNHYRLSGNTFCQVSQTGVSTSLGTILGSDQASLPYSFSTQGIVVNGQFWLYDPVGGLNRVTDPNVRSPIDGVWIDGRYCLTDGSYLYHTDIVAGVPVETQINPLSVAVAQFSPTPTVGVGESIDNLWIAFNRYTIEFFEDVGGDTFAFQRVATRAINCGLVATHGKAYLDDIWFFVGSRKYEQNSVYAMGMNSVEKIATREIEKILAKYADSQLVNTVMEVRQLEGYSYLIIHLPNEVLLYNHTLAKQFGIDNAWSILITGTEGYRWRGINGIFDPRIGHWIYGDIYDSRLGQLDPASGAQYGDPQEFYLNTPFIDIETGSIDQVEILTLPGWNVTDDATVFVSLTNDGVSYSMEVPLAYGAPSQYGKRFIMRRLGYCPYYFSLRLRGVSTSRMVFSEAVLTYS